MRTKYIHANSRIDSHSRHALSNKAHIMIAMQKVRKRVVAMLVYVCFCVFFTDCKKLVETDPPTTSTTGASVFNSDENAAAVLTGIYARLSASSSFGSGDITNFSILGALSSDELSLYSGVSNTSTTIAYYKNSLSSSTTAGGAGFELWNSIYRPYIFICNSAIEGLNNSNSLTPIVKQCLLGEAKFLRAFFYFYLINLYGDVALSTTTDYKINASLARSPKSEVYKQIIEDLKEAQDQLGDNYVEGNIIKTTSARTRPNKWAATALLARVYLYTGDYTNAEQQASLLIDNKNVYALTSLDNVFLKDSKEAIWQLQPVISGHNTEDALILVIPQNGPSTAYPFFISNMLLASFESNDQRRYNRHWIDSVNIGASPTTTYFFPYKYKKATVNTEVTEYLTVLRLGEQYLIRAEARAKQNNFLGAQEDLNTIRSRAGLSALTINSQSEMLKSIYHERQVELFTEWGHRWLDLKRTGLIDPVMQVVCPKKGGVWNTNWQLYPLFIGDIEKDPNLVQNMGY